MLTADEEESGFEVRLPEYFPLQHASCLPWRFEKKKKKERKWDYLRSSLRTSFCQKVSPKNLEAFDWKAAFCWYEAHKHQEFNMSKTKSSISSLPHSYPRAYHGSAPLMFFFFFFLQIVCHHKSP